MATTWNKGPGKVHHHFADDIGWILVPASISVWPIWPWFNALWEHAPTPTALYMIVSAAFMLFQMFDKMGLLERFKRHGKSEASEPPELPDHEGKHNGH
jgi:hypothetical protein